VLVWTAALALAWGAPAGAQQFGRNKVRYDRFEFRVLRTPHLDLYYYPAEEVAVGYAAGLAERWYARLSRVLEHEFTSRQPVVLYASHSHFTQNTILPGFVPDGVGGVTEHLKGRVILPFAAGLGETEHVLGHELVHVFQREILRAHGRSIELLPLWFLEGMAEYLTIGRLDVTTAMWLRDAVGRDRLPTIAQLQDPRYFPYRYGQALWTYLADRFGDGIVTRALTSTAPGGAIGRLAHVTGVDARTLSDDWHRSLRARFGDAPPAPRPAADTPSPLRRSAALVTSDRHRGRLNIAPALSPDGRELVFLSERDQYSIDVYLADAATGRIIRRLVQMAVDPHFESLQFIRSAGTWAPAARQFAIAGMRSGDAVISIIDVDTGAVVREAALDGLDEAYGPSWAPDGRRLVFTGMKGGLSDLYVLDLESGKVDALTSDVFADLQPAWSPDGRTIAFATDRFSSSLDTLSFGPVRLAAFDLETAQVRPLPGLPGERNIDPQWSPDGRSVYFLADSRQRTQVYRVDLGTGVRYQITALDQDVSGVTALSPALSAAAAAPRLAFSTYRGGGYDLHVIESPSSGGVPAADIEAGTRIAERPGGAWQPSTFGLLERAAFQVAPYDSGLALTRIGQPYLSMGGGSFGSFMRAGISFGFGDMLDQHSLSTALQVGKELPDFGLRVAYLNRRSRWTWGVAGEQVGAALSASRSTAAVSTDAGRLLRQSVRLTQIHRRVSGAAIYPFSRSRRIELHAGVHSATYLRRTETSAYTVPTGTLLDRSVQTSGAARPLRLVEAGGAWVKDDALFGPVSPLIGSRYRFSLTPTSGDLTFAAATADYRRYAMPRRPLTVAWRLGYSGRVGRDAADPRLQPILYDLRDVVRGYRRSALGSSICDGSIDVGCTLSALLSTRHVLVHGLELRWPLLGVRHGRPRYGRVPIESFAFADSAWFWLQPAPPDAWRNVLLQSVGAGVRVRAAWFTFEVAAAHRMGPPRGWTTAVNLRPGF
jgi:Tol biopolymer transport system component